MTKRLIPLLAALLLPVCAALAQDTATKTVTGVVMDSGGVPVPGAFVEVAGAGTGVATDIDGRFSINVREGATLSVSFMGYDTYSFKVSGASRYDIVLQETATMLEDVVVVGYGVQKKESVVGAIAQVSGSALVESGVSNITNSISGKLSGVTTIQTSGQPGANSASIIIRGVSSLNSNSPLILVDGVERDWNDIDPNEVATVSVLKDASATAVYGAKGANGVIIVTTKTGQEGKPSMNFSFSQGLSFPTAYPKHVDAYTTMSLYNVAMKNGGNYESMFSEAELAEYAHPSTALNSVRYPDIDWFKELTRDFASTTDVNFNMSGGTRFVKYFATAGFSHEGTLFRKSDATGKSFDYKRFNVRTNFDFQVTPVTVVSLKLGGSVGIQTAPYTDSSYSIWKSLLGSSTTKYPMYYPAWMLEEYPDENYPNASGIRLISSGNGDQTSENPYYALQRGAFNQYTNTTLLGDLSVKQKLDFITPGLDFRAKLSVSSYFKYRTLTSAYKRSAWDFNFNTALSGTGNPWTRYGTDGYVYTDDPVIFSGNEANSLQSGYYTDLYYDFSLNWARSFGKHNVTALALMNREEKHISADIPYYSEALVGRVTYDYAHKYLAEFNVGYTGSEQFAPSNRFGLFPSGAVGWVVSEEPFFQRLKPVFSKLKIRGSAGIVGEDYASERWLYLSSFSKDSGGNIVEDKGANLTARWEEATKYDIAVEMGFLDNEISLTADFFREDRDGQLVSADDITTRWVAITSKNINAGVTKSHGFELEAAWNKRLGNDWTLKAGGNFSFSESRIVSAAEGPGTLAHQSKEGTALGSVTNGAYLIDGDVYKSVDEIHSYVGAVVASNLVIGDYKFLDYTADRTINRYDIGILEGSIYPNVSYGFNLGFKWKNLDFDALFQGTALKWSVYDWFYEYAFIYSTWLTYTSALDYWSPANPGATHNTPHYNTYQSLSWAQQNDSATGGYVRLPGHSWRRSDYLRLKDLTLRYTLDGKNVRNLLGIKGLQLYVTGTNLLTFSGIKDADPERQYMTYGAYPVMKTVKFGAKISF